MTYRIGKRVRWAGPGEDRGEGVVTASTWQNGCYVRWDRSGKEEPCYSANLCGAGRSQK